MDPMMMLALGALAYYVYSAKDSAPAPASTPAPPPAIENRVIGPPLVMPGPPPPSPPGYGRRRPPDQFIQPVPGPHPEPGRVVAGRYPVAQFYDASRGGPPVYVGPLYSDTPPAIENRVIGPPPRRRIQPPRTCQQWGAVPDPNNPGGYMIGCVSYDKLVPPPAITPVPPPQRPPQPPPLAIPELPPGNFSVKQTPNASGTYDVYWNGRLVGYSSGLEPARIERFKAELAKDLAQGETSIIGI